MTSCTTTKINHSTRCTAHKFEVTYKDYKTEKNTRTTKNRNRFKGLELTWWYPSFDGDVLCSPGWLSCPPCLLLTLSLYPHTSASLICTSTRRYGTGCVPEDSKPYTNHAGGFCKLPTASMFLCLHRLSIYKYISGRNGLLLASLLDVVGCWTPNY